MGYHPSLWRDSEEPTWDQRLLWIPLPVTPSLRSEVHHCAHSTHLTCQPPMDPFLLLLLFFSTSRQRCSQSTWCNVFSTLGWGLQYLLHWKVCVQRSGHGFRQISILDASFRADLHPPAAPGLTCQVLWLVEGTFSWSSNQTDSISLDVILFLCVARPARHSFPDTFIFTFLNGTIFLFF